VLLYSELDEDRYEVRKIEIYRDNRIGYADIDSQFNETELGEEPVPEIEEINKELEFFAIQISSKEFEMVWEDLVSIHYIFPSLAYPNSNVM
jgi:hypothetical protein